MKIFFADPIGHILGLHDKEICRYLAQKGHKVILATNEKYPFLNVESEFEQITPFKGIVGNYNFVVKGINYVRSLIRVWRQICRFQPNVVIYYYILQITLDNLFIRNLRNHGIPAILGAHDILPLSSNKEYRHSYRKIYNNATAILAFSEYGKNQLISNFGIPLSKIQVLFFGMSEGEKTFCRKDQIISREKLGLQIDEPIILCFGQIKKNKGLKYLLDAFAGVLVQEPKARLLVIGRPWKVSLKPYFEQVKRLGIGQRVLFRPELVSEEVARDFLIASDVVVLPYTYLYQSAVLSLVCSVGKPIIATRVGNIPEILQDGETGYLVPPEDAKALEEAMLDVISNPEEAQRRGYRAQEMMQKNYSWERFCQELEKTLEKVTVTVHRRDTETQRKN
ncbi:MAG: glycosyltransferase family 4 protein [bacterium]